MTVYRWKPGSEWRNGDVQRVGEQLKTLADEHGDQLTPTLIVEAARPEDTPLHRLFEWNNDRAAELYRRQQARRVMQSIEVIPNADSSPRKMFVAVVEKKPSGDVSKVYVSTERAMSDVELTLQILNAAMDFIESFRSRYGQFKELALIADRAQMDIHGLMRKRELLNRLTTRKRKPRELTPASADVVDIEHGPSQMKELLDEFDVCYRDKMGVAAPIVAGKDHKLAKQLLERYEVGRLKVWVRRFFQTPDPFIRQSGYSFGVFFACIGKMIALDKKSEPTLSDKTIRNVQAIYGK